MSAWMDILKRPVVTERTTALRENRHQVVFEVLPGATKEEIAKAVEKAFKVKVVSVNTIVVRGKKKRMGRYEGRTPSWKKAIVRLRPEDKIEIFEGV